MMRYCWEDLVDAIIMRAVSDYRSASRRVRRYPGAKKTQAQIRDCEQFFRSRWFRVLTEINGEELISRLRSEAA